MTNLDKNINVDKSWHGQDTWNSKMVWHTLKRTVSGGENIKLNVDIISYSINSG